MVRITLIIVLGLIVSCKSPKNTVVETISEEKIPEIVVTEPETPSTDEAPIDTYSLAVVKIWDCGPVIEIMVEMGCKLPVVRRTLNRDFK
jgi:hypothetical protein